MRDLTNGNTSNDTTGEQIRDILGPSADEQLRVSACVLWILGSSLVTNAAIVRLYFREILLARGPLTRLRAKRLAVIPTLILMVGSLDHEFCLPTTSFADGARSLIHVSISSYSLRTCFYRPPDDNW